MSDEIKDILKKHFGYGTGKSDMEVANAASDIEELFFQERSELIRLIEEKKYKAPVKGIGAIDVIHNQALEDIQQLIRSRG